MLKHIEDKEDKMRFKVRTLFNNMTDDDFIAVHNAGQLSNLCLALSIDLQPKDNEKDTTYYA